MQLSGWHLSAAAGSTYYTAAYQFLTCSPGAVEEPASTQEVAAVVAGLYRQAQSGAPVTLRVSRPHFHSTASFVCPVGTASGNAFSSTGAGNASRSSSSSSAVGEVGLLQTKLNKVLAVDPAQHTMRAEAGMTVTELTQAATQNKMSLQVRLTRTPQLR